MRSSWFVGFLVIAFTVSQQITGSPIRNDKKRSQSQNQVTKTNVQNTANAKSLQKKSNLIPQQTLQKEAFEDAKKKGTIRINGPWRSDSGIDRNIDPQEDSYVKKVIASNEGLNFNKDMAEAGDVFDVNGIEDFYDKSALITYEVNGHEIPVHMKPKLTPQNQPMFPEYGHDSPSSPEIPASRSNNAPTHYSPPLHRATTFFGMSLKDMPEYKVLDTPSVGEKSSNVNRAQPSANQQMNGDDNSFSSRQRLAAKTRPSFPDTSLPMPLPHHGAASFSEPQPPVDRFSAEYAQANSFGQEDVRLGNKLQGLDTSQSPQEDGVAGFARKPSDPRLSGPQQYFDKNRNENYEHFAGNDGRYENQARFSEQAEPIGSHGAQEMYQGPASHNTPQDISEFHHENKRPYTEALDQGDQFKMHGGLKEFYNKPTKSSESNSLKPSEDSFLAGESRGVGKEYDGEKLAPAEVSAKEHGNEKQSQTEKGDDSSSFFEQLEKMDEQKQKNDRGEPSKETSGVSVTGESRKADKEKNKAKEKLLKILGDLTSKLKGMEAAVKDTHTDERRESSSMYDNQLHAAEQQISDYYAAKQKAHSSQAEAEEHAARETEEHDSRDAESAMEHAAGNIDSHDSRQKPDENARLQEEMAERLEAANHPEHSYRPEHTQDADTSSAASHHYSNTQENEERPEQISHMISKYKQHDKPFIFNTESVDYKAPHHSDQSDESSDGKDHVHHQPAESHRLYERPIISAFYHDPHSDHYQDLDDSPRSHSESSISDNHEVTPTQRDGGRKSGDDNSKDDESFEDKETKASSEGNKKADAANAKIREADNKPEIDEDLPDYNEVKDAAIFEENLIRKKYHSDPLRWSDDLSDDAQKEADDLAGEKNLDLSKSKIPKGMNTALLPLNSLNVGKDSADLWQKESSKFDFLSPLVTKKNSDFAQMVWKSAKEFGLGVAKTRDKENWIVVSKYDAPIVTEYQKLKANLESDVPLPDPYSDIARR